MNEKEILPLDIIMKIQTLDDEDNQKAPQHEKEKIESE